MTSNYSYLYQDRLTSERLITSMLTMDLILPWSEFFKDQDSMRFLPNFHQGNPLEMSAYWIDKQLNRYKDKRYGLQALFDKKTGELVGQCGLLTQDIGGKQELEVGYHILPKYRGMGLAPEAARMFINFAFENNQASSIISIIETTNINSQKVADKNGLVRAKQTVWNQLQIFIYRIDCSDWNK